MTEAAEAQTPEVRAAQPNFLTETHFSDFDLHPSLLQGLADCGFLQCTPIQAETLPITLSGRDVAGQAQTGTGKTAAFLVTVLNRLAAEPRPEDGAPRALLVAPTRELAQQIYQEGLDIGRHLDIRLVQVVGGVEYDEQSEALKTGVDVVVCTPGRIIDYLRRKVFKTHQIQMVVIDEADRLFDLGFTKDMRFILRKLPSYEKRQSMLFSATLSYRVLELTYEYMNLPEFISVTPQDLAVDGIDQELYHVGEDQKLQLLLGLLERESWERVLIFVNTKVGVEWLTKKLKGNGLPAEMITGDLPQKKRFQLMERYKSGKIRILVATDVASRGIHVEDISHVVNYDLPQDPENYVHRIGRTARAGKAGKAVALACERYVLHLEPLEEMLGYKLPVVWPEDDWYVADKAGRVVVESRQRMKRDGGGRAKPSRAEDRREKKPARPVERGGPAERGPAERGKEWPRPAGRFPGSFFGFGPQTAVADEFPVEDAEDEAVEVADGPAPPAATGDAAAAPPAGGAPKPKKKRRRPRRRRKKAPEAGTTETTADTPPSSDEAPSSRPNTQDAPAED